MNYQSWTIKKAQRLQRCECVSGTPGERATSSGVLCTVESRLADKAGTVIRPHHVPGEISLLDLPLFVLSTCYLKWHYFDRKHRVPDEEMKGICSQGEFSFQFSLTSLRKLVHWGYISSSGSFSEPSSFPWLCRSLVIFLSTLASGHRFFQHLECAGTWNTHPQ